MLIKKFLYLKNINKMQDSVPILIGSRRISNGGADQDDRERELGEMQ